MHCLYIIFAFLGTHMYLNLYTVSGDDLKNANTDFLVQEICSEVRKTLTKSPLIYIMINRGCDQYIDITRNKQALIHYSTFLHNYLSILS